MTVPGVTTMQLLTSLIGILSLLVFGVYVLGALAL